MSRRKLIVIDEITERSLATLVEYLKATSREGKISQSQAIKFAIITKAADIRTDARKAEIQPAPRAVAPREQA